MASPPPRQSPMPRSWSVDSMESIPEGEASPAGGLSRTGSLENITALHSLERGDDGGLTRCGISCADFSDLGSDDEYTPVTTPQLMPLSEEAAEMAGCSFSPVLAPKEEQTGPKPHEDQPCASNESAPRPAQAVKASPSCFGGCFGGFGGGSKPEPGEALLPPPLDPAANCLVIDLDQTLICSTVCEVRATGLLER